MSLDKRLKLGGLQVGGPRTIQNPARFRIANNVFQTRDEYTIPRYHGEEYLDFSSPPSRVIGLARYNDALFSVGIAAPGEYRFYNNDGDEIPIPWALPTPIFDTPPDIELAPNGLQYVEKLGCLFIGMPYNHLLKYDGFQAYRAGAPLPYFSCAQHAAAGAVYVRVVQHHLDFQGNNIYSGYVQFQATPVAGNITFRVDKGATDIIGSPLAFDVVPTSRPSWEKFDGSFDEFFFRASAHAVNAGQNEIVMTTGGDHAVAVGAYIVVNPQFFSKGVSGFTKDALGLALRVKSFTGTTVTLDLLDAKYLDNDRQWMTENLPPANALAVTLDFGVNYWLSVWTSNVSTGTYVFQNIVPAMYNSNFSYTQVVSVATPTVAAAGSENILWVLAPILGDIYDVTSLKGVLPRPSGSVNPTSCFSTYGDLMLMSYLNEVYFSDTSLGGAFEMINGFSFIVVGEGDDGNVQSVCGTADFMVVSRQFRNYYVLGNIPTANYRATEISKTSLGAYSNECMIAVVDKVILFNMQGVWAIYNGGRCEEVSEQIQGFFNNFSNTTSFDEEAYFSMDSFSTYSYNYNTGEPNGYGKWIRPRFDTNRNLLIFLTQGEDKMGKILVLNLNNGEFYTWNGMLVNYPFSGNPSIQDMTFIDGFYYVTVNFDDGVTFDTAVYIEDKTIPRPIDYMVDEYRPRLDTSWFTAGEPSLEKKTKQLKMWGIIKGDIEVNHALDWQQSGTTSDGEYTSDSDQTFSHKKRMESSNALACSVSLQFSGDRLEVEGLELEWEPFQMGMKR